MAAAQAAGEALSRRPDVLSLDLLHQAQPSTNLLAAVLSQTGGLPDPLVDVARTPDAARAHLPLWAAGLDGRGHTLGVGDDGLDVTSCYLRDNGRRPYVLSGSAANVTVDRASGRPLYKDLSRRKVRGRPGRCTGVACCRACCGRRAAAASGAERPGRGRALAACALLAQVTHWLAWADFVSGSHGTHTSGTLAGACVGDNATAAPDLATGEPCAPPPPPPPRASAGLVMPFCPCTSSTSGTALFFWRAVWPLGGSQAWRRAPSSSSSTEAARSTGCSGFLRTPTPCWAPCTERCAWHARLTRGAAVGARARAVMPHASPTLTPARRAACGLTLWAALACSLALLSGRARGEHVVELPQQAGLL